MVRDFSQVLEQLGLAQYRQAFIDEGFDCWETLQDITESDLQALDVKLGHRRKLQRAIINARGQTKDNVPLGSHPQLGPSEDSQRSEGEASSTRELKTASAATMAANPAGQKRKYRRHPKPDEFAPERPPSAYVIFLNQMRDKLKGQDLSFTEIAKIVGENWQDLAPREKEPCERQAQALKEKFYADLNEYKKTPQYAQYQEYLAEFKAKDASKKTKADSEVRDPTRHNSIDQGDRFLEVQPDGSRIQDDQSPGHPDTTSSGWNEAISPTNTFLYPMEIPKGADVSPKTHSPRPAGFRPLSLGAPSEDGSWAGASSKRQAIPLHLLPGPTYPNINTNGNGAAHPKNPSSPPNAKHRALVGADNPGYAARRIANNSGTLPSLVPTLTRDGTTRSNFSDASHNAGPWCPSTHNLPPIDDSKLQTSRILPSPGSMAGVTGGTYPRPNTSASSASSLTQALPNGAIPLDTHAKSSIAALLRAGEQLDRGSEQVTSRASTSQSSRLWERESAA